MADDREMPSSMGDSSCPTAVGNMQFGSFPCADLSIPHFGPSLGCDMTSSCVPCLPKWQARGTPTLLGGHRRPPRTPFVDLREHVTSYPHLKSLFQSLSSCRETSRGRTRGERLSSSCARRHRGPPWKAMALTPCTWKAWRRFPIIKCMT